MQCRIGTKPRDILRALLSSRIFALSQNISLFLQEREKADAGDCQLDSRLTSKIDLVRYQDRAGPDGRDGSTALQSAVWAPPTCTAGLMHSTQARHYIDNLGTRASSGWDPTLATSQVPGAPGGNAG